VIYLKRSETIVRQWNATKLVKFTEKVKFEFYFFLLKVIYFTFYLAVDLARVCAPSEVVKLESEWGDYLVSQKLYDGAINHFIEAGESLKAVDAAINSRQWKKAVDILQTQNSEAAYVYYKKIADYYSSIQEHEVR